MVVVIYTLKLLARVGSNAWVGFTGSEGRCSGGKAWALELTEHSLKHLFISKINGLGA